MPRYSCPKCLQKVQDKGKNDAIGSDVMYALNGTTYHAVNLVKHNFKYYAKSNLLNGSVPNAYLTNASNVKKLFDLKKKNHLLPVL